MNKTNKIHYCPISFLQQRFGMYVTGAGREITNPGEPYPHAYHSSDYYFTWQNGRTLTDWEYQILYIRTGKGIIEFKRGESLPIAAGSVIILHPGEWHRYRPDPATGWSEAYIGFGGGLLERIFAPPFFDRRPTVMRLEPGGKFERDLLSLVDEIQSDSASRPYSLAAQTLALVASLFERPQDGTKAHAANTAIRKANLYIAHHLGEVIDFPALAGRCGMGYSLFRRRFRAYNGTSPLEYQIALRIRRAAHLLASSDIPVAQIARETGFRTLAYFSRFFHKESGTSPSEYRRTRKDRQSAVGS